MATSTSGAESTGSIEYSSHQGTMSDRIDEDLKYMVIQLCEEVSFLRMTKKESEERMRHLVTDEHKHERQLEEEILKNSILKENHEQRLLDLDRSYKDEIKHLSREKSKLIWENKSWEKDVISVKDEVRSLQLEKYNLERMIREQSHLLKTQTAAGESYMKQVVHFQEKFKNIKQCSEKCNAQVLSLSKEVKEAKVLNERLSFINTHHGCIKRDLESKVEDKEIIISELEVKFKIHETMSEIKPTERETVGLLDKEELKQLKSNEAILKKQLDSCRQRNRELSEQLDESHGLIDQYVSVRQKYKDSISMMDGEKKDMEVNMSRMECERQTEKQRQENLEKEMDQLKTKWNEKEKRFLSEVLDLTSNLEALTETTNELETKNISLETGYRNMLVTMKSQQEQLYENAKTKVDVGTMTLADSCPFVKPASSDCYVQTCGVIGACVLPHDRSTALNVSTEMKTQANQCSLGGTYTASMHARPNDNSDSPRLDGSSSSMFGEAQGATLSGRPNRDQTYVEHTSNEHTNVEEVNIMHDDLIVDLTDNQSSSYLKQISEDKHGLARSKEGTEKVDPHAVACLRRLPHSNVDPASNEPKCDDDGNMEIYKEPFLAENSCKMGMKTESVCFDVTIRPLTCVVENGPSDRGGVRIMSHQEIEDSNEYHVSDSIARDEGRGEYIPPKTGNNEQDRTLGTSSSIEVAAYRTGSSSPPIHSSDTLCVDEEMKLIEKRMVSEWHSSGAVEALDNADVMTSAEPDTGIVSSRDSGHLYKTRPASTVIEQTENEYKVDIKQIGQSKEVNDGDQFFSQCNKGTSINDLATAHYITEMQQHSHLMSSVNRTSCETLKDQQIGVQRKELKDISEPCTNFPAHLQVTDDITDPTLSDNVVDIPATMLALVENISNSGHVFGDVDAEQLLVDYCEAAVDPAQTDIIECSTTSSTCEEQNQEVPTTPDKNDVDIQQINVPYKLNDSNIDAPSLTECHATTVMPLVHTGVDLSTTVNELCCSKSMKCNQDAINSQGNAPSFVPPLPTPVLPHSMLGTLTENVVRARETSPTLLSWDVATESTTDYITTSEPSNNRCSLYNYPSQYSPQENKPCDVPVSSHYITSPPLLTSSGSWLASDEQSHISINTVRQETSVNVDRPVHPNLNVYIGKLQSPKSIISLTHRMDLQVEPSDVHSPVGMAMKPVLPDLSDEHSPVGMSICPDVARGRRQNVTSDVKYLNQLSVPFKDSTPNMEVKQKFNLSDQATAPPCTLSSLESQSNQGRDVNIISVDCKEKKHAVVRQLQPRWKQSPTPSTSGRRKSYLITDDTEGRSKGVHLKDKKDLANLEDVRPITAAPKRPHQFEDPSEMSLFSDEDEDISSSLSKEIERAQSILNRSRLKKPRRCKPVLSILSGKPLEE